MKQHTNAFRQNIKELGRQLDVKISYTLDNEEHIVELSNILNVSRIIEGGILKSVMKQLELELKEYIAKDTILNLQIGIKVGNDYEYMNYGNFIIRDEPTYNADTQSYSYICYDKMLYAMRDYENMNIVYPISIRDYINTICNKIGLTFKNINTEFANYDKEIQNELYLTTNGESLGYTYRDVLDELAEVTASTICINEGTDELEIRYITETNDSIDEDFIKDTNVQLQEKYGPVNMIVLSRANADNIYYPDIIPQNPCEIKIIDNQIMNWDNRDTYMPDIYEKLNGLEYYKNDFSSFGILWYELCDMYTINIGEDSYKCVLLNDEINIQQGLEELIHTDMPEQSVTDYHTADTSDNKVKKTIFQVKKQEGQIQSIVSEIGDRSQKTTTITQDIDGIESAVQDIEDLTNIVSGIKTVSITDAYPNNDILELHIYGNNSVFNYLYPRNDLYPSSTLYPHGDSKVKLTNSQETTIIDLGIIEVLRQNTEVRDEAIIDYLGNISVIRRVNKDGTTKSNPTTTTLGQAHFTLAEGTNTFEIVTYSAPIEVKYAMKTAFTEIFATRTEMSSEIKQTAQSINLSVNQKLSNYSTTTEMYSAITLTATEINSVVATKVGENEVISKINQSAERVQIEADKISLKGKLINLTSDNIVIASTNFNVDKNGNITCSNANITGTVTATSGKIAGYTINGNQLIGNSVGLSGLSGEGWAFWAGSNDAGNAPFRVGHDGSLVATSADISGTITATSGTFRNCTITDSCSVPASTVSGTLESNNIPNLSASKITSGTMSGSRISGGTISGSNVDGVSVSGDIITVNSDYGHYDIGSYTGQNYSLIVQQEGQYWRRLRFRGGILIGIDESW